MANKHMKNLTLFLIREMKMKTTTHPPEWLRGKTDYQLLRRMWHKLELQCCRWEYQLVQALDKVGLTQRPKLHIHLPYDSTRELLGTCPQRRLCMSIKDMYKNVQSSCIVERQKLETAQMPIKRRRNRLKDSHTAEKRMN